MRRRPAPLAALLVLLAVGTWSGSPELRARADIAPRLTDAEFWRLVDEFSEPNGFFRSDNLVSNEDTFQFVIPELQRVVKPGGIYLGVGPDQNFTYLVALRPRLAFITDIRRGNLQLHLMYKAIIELSTDRAEFLSRLFSRRRPPGLGPGSTPEQLFAAYSMVGSSRDLYEENQKAIVDHLRHHHEFKLDDEDVAGINYVFGSFYAGGPALAYANGGGFGRSRYPTFQDLQMATDGQGLGRAYLASEDNFRVLKLLEQNNLIVPIVGNFAGSRALRSVGAYLRAHGATVTAFYASNVEQYLFQDRLWPDFARNIAALPLDATSTFIRSCFNNCAPNAGYRSVTMLDSMQGLLKDFDAGRIGTYWDVLSHRRYKDG
jgi:hypothetical protein